MRRRRRRKSSPTPGEGRSCCTGVSGEGEIDAIDIPTPPWLGRRHLINISISTIITTISIYEIDFIPLIVCVELNPGYRFEASCMFVIGTLSLFGGEIIYSDCVVIIMPLVHIMFDTFE